MPDRHPLRLGWHYARAFVAAFRYGFPARHLTVIGITGTDGKTTTVNMVTHILRSAGIRVGTCSTAFFDVAGERTWNATQKTSVSPFVLQRFLRRLVREGCTHAIIEVSSHGLVQGRIHYLWPTVAAVTNVTPEHLDYHGSMEQYRADKGKLFRMLRGRGTKVLNGADPSFFVYRHISSQRTITYGVPGSDFWIEDIAADASQTRAVLRTGLGGSAALILPIPGVFNLENALCAIGCATALDVPLETCIRVLESFAGTPGRMERIDEGQDFHVFVDFTVTPVAYERTLRALRTIVGDKGARQARPTAAGQGRVLVLCGSCGDRMREKRPEVGRIVSEYADVAVVTNEDPYMEDPLRIIEDVWSGIRQDRVRAKKIPDRREAITFLLSQARPGDAVIFCAKGADTTMWTATGQIPWDERAIVREILRELRT